MKLSMFTRWAFVSVSAVAMQSCGGSGVSGPSMLKITGAITDSLSNLPIRALWVVYGLDSVMPDSNGHFSMAVTPHSDTVVVRWPGFYAPFHRVLGGGRDTSLAIRLRRVIPWLYSFSADSAGTVKVTLINLDGAGRVVRTGTSSWMLFNDGDVTQSSTIPAYEWTWVQKDSLRWQITVPTGFPGIINTVWMVADSINGPATETCLPATHQCLP